MTKKVFQSFKNFLSKCRDRTEYVKVRIVFYDNSYTSWHRVSLTNAVQGDSLNFNKQKIDRRHIRILEFYAVDFQNNIISN